MRVSVTGTTGLERSDPEARIVLEAIRGLKGRGVTEFTTGGAEGVDTVAAIMAVEVLGPKVCHRVVLPGAPYSDYWDNRSHLAFFAMEHLCRLPGQSFGSAYMARNDVLVEYADLMLAFPATGVEVVRSGTWATVRRARKAGVPVELHPLR